VAYAKNGCFVSIEEAITVPFQQEMEQNNFYKLKG